RAVRVLAVFAHTSVLSSSLADTVDALDCRFRSSQLRDTQPTYAPVQRFVSYVAVPTHDSGSGWFATPFLYDSFIHYFTPVYPDDCRPWAAWPFQNPVEAASASHSSSMLRKRAACTKIPSAPVSSNRRKGLPESMRTSMSMPAGDCPSGK